MGQKLWWEHTRRDSDVGQKQWQKQTGEKSDVGKNSGGNTLMATQIWGGTVVATYWGRLRCVGETGCNTLAETHTRGKNSDCGDSDVR